MYLCRLSLIYLPLSESTWWKGQAVIHTSICSLLALVWTIQLVRTVHAERETVNMQAGEEAGYLSSLPNPFQYEEGRSGMILVSSVSKVLKKLRKKVLVRFRRSNN